MKLKFYFFIICIFTLSIRANSFQNNYNYMFQNNNRSVAVSDDDDPHYFEILQEAFYQVIYEIINNNQTKNNLTSTCIEQIQNSYLDKNVSSLYFLKLLKDSSKNKNDVGSFTDCRSNKYDMKANRSFLRNFTYLVVDIHKCDKYNKTNLLYEEGFFLFGICFIKGCDKDDYLEIFKRYNQYFSNPLDLDDGNPNQFDIIDMGSYILKQNQTSKYIYLIPFYIMVMQLIFMLFPKIPAYLFICFFKRVKIDSEDYTSSASLPRIMANSNSSPDSDPVYNASNSIRPQDNNLSNNSIKPSDGKINNSKPTGRRTLNKLLLFKFKSAFSISNHGEELFSTKNTEFNNDSGLRYLRGIRTFYMTFLVIGNVFTILINSPVKIYSKECFLSFLKNYLFSFVFIGVRFAPRVLLSCSGFTLVYKLLFYLDERVDDLNVLTEQEESVLDNLTRDKNESDYKKISYVVYFRFVFSQLYKYLYYVWYVLYFKFSFHIFYSLLESDGPIWMYLKTSIIDKLCIEKIVGYVFLFEIFKIGEIQSVSREILRNIFWLPINEIVFFVITSFIIFISYKKNWRTDIFFIFIFIFIIILRFVLVIKIEGIYPSLFYYFDGFGAYFINPIYNYTFYIIGVFFGKMNYSVQKSLRKKDVLKLGKKYLLFNIQCSKIFKSKSKVLNLSLIIISFCVALFISFITPFSLNLKNLSSDQASGYYNNKIINYFMLIDIEIFVILTQVSGFSAFMMGENYIYKILSNPYFSSISKQYFSYILLINLNIIMLFYGSQSRIQLDYRNIIFFSLVTYVFMLAFSSLMYIFGELPYKIINKLIVRNKS